MQVSIRPVINKLKRKITTKKRLPLLQFILIWLVFALMVGISCYFIFISEQSHMLRAGEDALTYTQSKITASLMEPETFLDGFSETIRGMILQGAGADEASAYMAQMTRYAFTDHTRLEGFNELYGFFEAFGGLYLSGWGRMPPEGYRPEDQPWYYAALEEKGGIIIADPYEDDLSGGVIIFARSISDEEGRHLGIICLDVGIDRIGRQAVETSFTEGGYGLLLSKNLKMIAHPSRMMIGLPLKDADSGISELADELRSGKNIRGYSTKNYRRENSIVYFQRIKYDWYVGTVVPVYSYYRRFGNMTGTLIMIGVVLAVTLTVFLRRITSASERLQAKDKQKSNFLARMSHEIRTPLNAIMGIVDIQLQNASLENDTKGAFARIYNSGDLLLGIVNDILDLSKIEAGKMEITLAKYDVASLINDIVHLNMMRIGSKRIEFKLEVDENIPSTLIGDELRIKQILNNLLSNAIKYTEKGRVTLSVNAEYGGTAGAVHVTLVFRINDTGQGMTQEQVSKLFEEYTRFNLETNRSVEGTGLGMAIARNLTELMYGKISVDSKPGRGTEITLKLPQRNTGIGISGVLGKEAVTRLQKFNFSSKSKKVQITRDPMPYGKVLIVDDVNTNIYVARGLMEFYDLAIDTAESGIDAVKKIKYGNMYDIIFMDHMMPKMDGIEAARIIRGMGYTRPIIALTANAVVGNMEMFLASGFDGFIAKPIDIHQLDNTLNRLIRDRKPLEVVEEARRQKKEKGDKSPGSAASKKTELTGIFIKDAEKAVAVLEGIGKNEYRTDGDVQTYTINVHAMKTALANIGELELSAVALKLEMAGREHDTLIISDETPVFLRALKELIERIRPREEDNGRALEDDEKNLLHEKLLVIKEACGVYDKKAAKEALAELKQKTWPHPAKEIINTIAEHLLHSDFEEAARTAGDFNPDG